MKRFLKSSAAFRNVTTFETNRVQVKNEAMPDIDKRRLNAWADLIPVDVKSLLDAGTKTGYFCRLMGERAVHACGLDDTARSNMERGIDFTLGDIRCLPFADNAFDCVTAFEILEHLVYPDVLKAVSELKRVARRVVIISVPYEEYPIKSVNHLQNFSEEKLHRVFEAPLSFTYFGRVPVGRSFLTRVANKCLRRLGLDTHQLGPTKHRWVAALYRAPACSLPPII